MNRPGESPPIGEIVGRDEELALIDRLLDGLGERRPAFLFLDGEPGIGKTRLLEALGEETEGRGWLLLDSRATEFESDVPFAVFGDACDGYLAANAPRLQRLIGAEEVGELGSVFPSLQGLGPERAQAPGPEDRVRSYRAVALLLEALSREQPLVLALDDLHWADRGSLELLGHLLRRRPDGALLVAGCFRTGQADPGFVSELDAAARGGGVECLHLEPLSRAAAEPLLAGFGEDRERLFRQSGGNPFYLRQLARDPGGAGSGSADPGPGAVPAQVAVAIERELGALSAPARRFAEGAACAGDPFDLDVAVAAAALEEGEALAALDELAALDLVRDGDAPREFHFRHPLVRAAVYEATAPGRRLAGHAR